MADRRGANSIIHRINWFRLVLDEGKFSCILCKIAIRIGFDTGFVAHL